MCGITETVKYREQELGEYTRDSLQPDYRCNAVFVYTNTGVGILGKRHCQALPSIAVSLPAGCVRNLVSCAAPRSLQLLPR